MDRDGPGWLGWTRTFPDHRTSPSDSLISLSYSMAAFSTNSFGLFHLCFGTWVVCSFLTFNFLSAAIPIHAMKTFSGEIYYWRFFLKNVVLHKKFNLIYKLQKNAANYISTYNKLIHLQRFIINTSHYKLILLEKDTSAILYNGLMKHILNYYIDIPTYVL